MGEKTVIRNVRLKTPDSLIRGKFQKGAREVLLHLPPLTFFCSSINFRMSATYVKQLGLRKEAELLQICAQTWGVGLVFWILIFALFTIDNMAQFWSKTRFLKGPFSSLFHDHTLDALYALYVLSASWCVNGCKLALVWSCLSSIIIYP